MHDPASRPPAPAWEAIGEALDRHQRILVTTHVNPDGDGLGAEEDGVEGRGGADVAEADLGFPGAVARVRFPGLLESYFTNAIKLSTVERQRLIKGEPLTKMLETDAYRRPIADLLLTIARAMGSNITTFGTSGTSAFRELLS